MLCAILAFLLTLDVSITRKKGPAKNLLGYAIRCIRPHDRPHQKYRISTAPPSAAPARCVSAGIESVSIRVETTAPYFYLIASFKLIGNMSENSDYSSR